VEPFVLLAWRADPTDCFPDPIRFERAGLDDEDDDDGFPSELAIVVIPLCRSQKIEMMVAGVPRWVMSAVPDFASRLRC
jgi:hypothetical protein